MSEHPEPSTSDSPLWIAAAHIGDAVRALHADAEQATVAHLVDMAELAIDNCPPGDAAHWLALVLDSVSRLTAAGLRDSPALTQRIQIATRLVIQHHAESRP